MRYFDTGVLLKLYLAEPRAAEAVSLVNEPEDRPPFTDLHGLEMKSALRQKEGRGEITSAECVTLLHDLQRDVSAGILKPSPASWPDVFARAEALSSAHGVATLCRSLDTLHVALAIELGATEFCTFDHRQTAMALAAGLKVIP
jgi:predicted nucleic acid-binding protein